MPFSIDSRVYLVFYAMASISAIGCQRLQSRQELTPVEAVRLGSIFVGGESGLSHTVPITNRGLTLGEALSGLSAERIVNNAVQQVAHQTPAAPGSGVESGNASDPAGGTDSGQEPLPSPDGRLLRWQHGTTRTHIPLALTQLQYLQSIPLSDGDRLNIVDWTQTSLDDKPNGNISYRLRGDFNGAGDYRGVASGPSFVEPIPDANFRVRGEHDVIALTRQVKYSPQGAAKEGPKPLEYMDVFLIPYGNDIRIPEGGRLVSLHLNSNVQTALGEMWKAHIADGDLVEYTTLRSTPLFLMSMLSNIEQRRVMLQNAAMKDSDSPRRRIAARGWLPFTSATREPSAFRSTLRSLRLDVALDSMPRAIPAPRALIGALPGL